MTIKPGLDRAREIIEIMVKEHTAEALAGDTDIMLEETKKICLLGEVSQRIKDNGKITGGEKC